MEQWGVTLRTRLARNFSRSASLQTAQHGHGWGQRPTAATSLRSTHTGGLGQWFCLIVEIELLNLIILI